ncbi:MAG: NlpC/P60 family protein [Verrucomicrobia bacterium]|nr:NlpC/P60 family protein [Verrucomicrobiota bacterium]
MNALHHAIDACGWRILEYYNGVRRLHFSYSAGRSLVASTIVTAALLLSGCQSTPRGHPPTHPSTFGGKAQETPLPPAQVRKPISPAAWKAEAEHWLGVKYRKGGTDRTGIDCSGLSSRIYLAVAGIALPRTTQDQSRCGSLVSRTDLRPGDLIFFVTLKDKQVDHVGIYLGDTKFVHASVSKGVVISSLLQDYYVQRYHSAKRIVL